LLINNTMITHIKTIHNEEISSSEYKRSIGVLLNFSSEPQHSGWKESFIYIFNHKTLTYIFFNTIVDMIDYNFYGKHGVRCAMMTEDEFDIYYDAQYIDGKFSDVLKWT